MSKQDKATTERNSKILRDLVKHPDNKVCADCKRNDPRWASWNLGVFLCIRCSGIHRGMGTHISRVKSVDLDIWTPEQMNSIQKWGNRRANLYWEVHLKAGHVPPEHKMDSFIRSKYESRRWALDGPPPSDPSVLESETSRVEASQAAANPPSVTAPSARPSHTANPSISGGRAASPAFQTYTTTRQSQSRQLLSSAIVGRATSTEIAATASPTTTASQPSPAQSALPAQDELFSLDFLAPTQKAASPLPPKDTKSDIMSLFSTSNPSTAVNAFGSASQPQSSWDQLGSAPQTQTQPQHTSLMGTSGTGLWGVSSGWNAAPTTSSQNNPWGGSANHARQQSQSQLNLFNTNDVWGSVSAPTNANHVFATSQEHAVPKKDDVFGDLWGNFK